MAAPFSSANFGSGCLKMMYFLLSGGSTLPLNLQMAGATGVFPHIIRLGASRLYVFRLLGRGWGVWEEGAGDQAEKKGFRFI